MSNNVANGFIGITRNGVISWETARPTPKEVWDAIFYNIEKANAQFPREHAPARLGVKWNVVGCALALPPNVEVLPDNISVRYS